MPVAFDARHFADLIIIPESLCRQSAGATLAGPGLFQALKCRQVTITSGWFMKIFGFFYGVLVSALAFVSCIGFWFWRMNCPIQAHRNPTISQLPSLEFQLAAVVTALGIPMALSWAHLSSSTHTHRHDNIKKWAVNFSPPGLNSSISSKRFHHYPPPSVDPSGMQG